MDSTTPYYFYNEARYFKEAAKTLLENKPADLSCTPIYYLIGHSIELYLKSYLLTKGYSVKTVKKVFGHNIEKLLKTASEYKKFYSTFGINKMDIKSIEEIIEVINCSYQSKELEYPSGTKIVPHLNHLFEITEIINKGCKILCENLIEKNYKKGKFEG